LQILAQSLINKGIGRNLKDGISISWSNKYLYIMSVTLDK